MHEVEQDVGRSHYVRGWRRVAGKSAGALQPCRQLGQVFGGSGELGRTAVVGAQAVGPISNGHVALAAFTLTTGIAHTSQPATPYRASSICYLEIWPRSNWTHATIARVSPVAGTFVTTKATSVYILWLHPKSRSPTDALNAWSGTNDLCQVDVQRNSQIATNESLESWEHSSPSCTCTECCRASHEIMISSPRTRDHRHWASYQMSLRAPLHSCLGILVCLVILSAFSHHFLSFIREDRVKRLACCPSQLLHTAFDQHLPDLVRGFIPSALSSSWPLRVVARRSKVKFRISQVRSKWSQIPIPTQASIDLP